MKQLIIPSTIILLVLLPVTLGVSCRQQSPPTPQPSGTLQIKWLGHAAFLITSSTGIKIITDPYAPSARLLYGEIEESANIVTVSHDHGDHNNVAAVSGNPTVVRGTTEVKGIEFEGIPTFHDDSQGKERGNNTIICFEVDGVRICHLGDLGHSLSDEQVDAIGKVDILLIPVGGHFTIDAALANHTSDQLKPSVVIPMHYKTDKSSGLPIAGVDEFLKGKTDVILLDTSEMEFKAGQLPATTQVMVPKPAL